MATFVKQQSVAGWTASLLSNCWLLEVCADDHYVAALVWVHLVDGADKVIEVHAAAAPEYRGRWLTARTLDSLFQVIGSSGARTVIAQVTTPIIGRIWRVPSLSLRLTVPPLFRWTRLGISRVRCGGWGKAKG